MLIINYIENYQRFLFPNLLHSPKLSLPLQPQKR